MKGCRDTGNHCVISMHTRRNLEILAQSVGSAGWSFQVYLYSNPDIVAGQIERAVRLGSRSVIITVDSSHRSPSYERQQHPWDARNFGQRDEVELPESRDDRAWTWKMLEDLIRSLRVPVAIKGVQSPTDALRAKEAGARVVWISNHGGRANETDQSLLREVTAIRGLVGPDVAVVVDGGFRTGTDIAKALLLGASHVALGRPLIYGLVSAGSQGVANVLGIANRELSLVLGSLGIRDVSDAAKHAEQVFETRERDSRPGD
jgi:isopentenyl diphosphate isomerase/L-lactate dehydrogenase-like FMN-dependent dehydrogenase